ncbi:MAG: ribosome maturation factor RimM [Bacteroidota bacterium]
MTFAPPDLYAVGTIAKAYGVRGDVVVQPLTDSAARFRKLRNAWLGRDTVAAREVRIERATVDSRGVRLKLEGIDDRTAAGELRGMMLFVDKTHRVRLPAGSYFVHDVIGLAVRDRDGADLGTVADVLRYPANDVYVVRGNGREFLLPAVREFVTAIDLATRTMTVRLIEGMVE